MFERRVMVLMEGPKIRTKCGAIARAGVLFLRMLRTEVFVFVNGAFIRVEWAGGILYLLPHLCRKYIKTKNQIYRSCHF